MLLDLQFELFNRRYQITPDGDMYCTRYDDMTTTRIDKEETGEKIEAPGLLKI